MACVILTGMEVGTVPRFRDVEAGGLETPAQGPRMGEAGFGLVSVTPKPPLWALMFPAFY